MSDPSLTSRLIQKTGGTSTEPGLSRFILPGDTRAGATLDFARATVRRAERAVSQLFHADGGDGLANGEALRYLNRLSDLLFVLARGAEAGEGGSTPARLHEPEPEPVQPANRTESRRR